MFGWEKRWEITAWRVTNNLMNGRMGTLSPLMLILLFSFSLDKRVDQLWHADVFVLGQGLYRLGFMVIETDTN
jgi:hypothetical protein